MGSVSEICQTLEVNRSCYYAWKNAPATNQEQSDKHLLPLVRMVFSKHRRRYGARRIREELKDLGYTCSTRRVAKLLKIQGLRAIQPKSFKPRTTDSRHRLGYSPNLLLGREVTTSINEVIVGDITYIPITGGTFSYLATLMDLHSRKVVGWHMAADMTDSLVIGALQNAIQGGMKTDGAIHHTDRGGQYASTKYRAMLRRANMRQSMSRADNCYDNAFMESCYGTLKTELEMTEYEDQQAAARAVRDYITYYNAERKHSAIGYLTPIQFEAKCCQSK